MLLALRSLWEPQPIPVAPSPLPFGSEEGRPRKAPKQVPQRLKDNELDLVKVLTEWLDRI